MDALVAFLIFTIALLLAGYYVWSVPQQQATDARMQRSIELTEEAFFLGYRHAGCPHVTDRRERLGVAEPLVGVVVFRGEYHAFRRPAHWTLAAQAGEKAVRVLDDV